MIDSRLRLLALMLLTLMTARPLSATTYVAVSDSSLLAGSPLVVEGRVIGGETGSGPYTEYRVEVTRWLKGSTASSPIRVRLPGGTDTANRTLRIEGMPRFALAQRVLLFLSQHDDGTYVPNHLGLGAFLRVEHPAGAVAVRDLGEALVLAPDGAPASPERQRDFDRFVAWIASESKPRANADYWIDRPTAEVLSFSQPFTLFENGGLNMRWAEFDTSGSVTFFANEDGQPDLPGGGFAEFQTALAAWTDHPTTPIEYLYGGTTPAQGGFSSFDMINAIQFDDPNDNGDFGGVFSCVGGGVLALGGPWFSSDTHQHNGTTFITILGADIVTNVNAGCFLALNGRSNAEEVFAHELGHTLGLRHSCGDAASGACDSVAEQEALMVAFAHGDGRGALLGEDDSQGIELLYRLGGPGCTPNTTTLCLDGTPGDGRFRVTLDFDSVLGGGIAGEAPTTPLALVNIPKGGIFSFTDAKNPELLVKVLNGCGINQHYWVFYAATTTLGFELTVTDTETGVERTYSNPDLMTAPPVADTEAFATCP